MLEKPRNVTIHEKGAEFFCHTSQNATFNWYFGGIRIEEINRLNATVISLGERTSLLWMNDLKEPNDTIKVTCKAMSQQDGSQAMSTAYLNTKGTITVIKYLLFPFMSSF